MPPRRHRFSFHGCHSQAYCRHARSPLADMVAQAAELGFTHLGITEHAPRYRTRDLYEDEAGLTPADLAAMFDAYAVEARRLQAHWADRLPILVGFEAETMPPDNWATYMTALRDSRRFDYMVGSVHNLGDTWIDYKPQITAALAERMGGPTAMHKAYFYAVAGMIRTLRPRVVGHLDLIRRYDGQTPAFAAEVLPLIDETLEAARAIDAALDVNAAPARKRFGPVYPLPSILKRARQIGVRVTLGDDSHAVADVGAGLDACLRAIADAGYRRVSYLVKSTASVEWREAALEDMTA